MSFTNLTETIQEFIASSVTDGDAALNKIELLVEQSLDFVESNKHLSLIMVNQRSSELSLQQLFVTRLLFNSVLLCRADEYDRSALKTTVRIQLLFLLFLGERWKKLLSLKPDITFANLAAMSKSIVQWSSTGKWRDQNAIRVISQIGKLNKFYHTATSYQHLVLLALNVTKDSITSNCSLVELLNSKLVRVTATFNHLSTNNEIFLTGGLCKYNDQVWLLVAINHDDSTIALLATNTDDEEQSLIHVKLSELRQVHYQQKISVSKYQQLLTDNEDILKNVAAKSNVVNLTLSSRYQAPNNYLKILQGVLSDNRKHIVNILQHHPIEAKFVLEHATKLNRGQTACTDVQHAISMLGTARIYPLLCSSLLQQALLKNKHVFHQLMYEKYRCFAQLNYHIAGQNSELEPEYQDLIARILFLALVTIPKAKFQATRPALKAANNSSLAALFGYNDLKTWKQLTLDLAKSWLLPKGYVQAINGYFSFLQSTNPSNANAIAVTLDKSTKLFSQIYAERVENVADQEVHNQSLIFELQPFTPLD